jgi:hypothetical protein
MKRQNQIINHGRKAFAWLGAIWGCAGCRRGTDGAVSLSDCSVTARGIDFTQAQMTPRGATDDAPQGNGWSHCRVRHVPPRQGSVGDMWSVCDSLVQAQDSTRPSGTPAVRKSSSDTWTWSDGRRVNH